MKIFIMRHCKAEDYAISDSQRDLTQSGRLTAYQQGMWLTQNIENFDAILVSPYNRAQQTYQQVRKAYLEQRNLDLDLAYTTWDAITPYGNPNIVTDKIEQLTKNNIANCFIVTHMPFMGLLVNRILAERTNINFNLGTIIEIAWNNGACELLNIKHG